MSGGFFIAAGWGAMVLISVTVGVEMARKRKRDPNGWMLLAAFLGPVALVALRLLGEALPMTPADKVRQARVGAAVGMVLATLLLAALAVPLFRACFRI
jgi:hypothetical protein